MASLDLTCPGGKWRSPSSVSVTFTLRLFRGTKRNTYHLGPFLSQTLREQKRTSFLPIPFLPGKRRPDPLVQISGPWTPSTVETPSSPTQIRLRDPDLRLGIRRSTDLVSRPLPGLEDPTRTPQGNKEVRGVYRVSWSSSLVSVNQQKGFTPPKKGEREECTTVFDPKDPQEYLGPPRRQ